MPTYQYACTNQECGNRFEQVQAFTDPSITQCPVCGQRVRKVYGSVGVVFKGSGFYRNDSREGSKAAAGEAKPSAEGAPETKSADSAKTDSTAKPAAASSAGSDGGSGKSKPAASSSPAPSTSPAST